MPHYGKYNSQHGMALIVVLIFMQILSILSWYAIETSLLEMKMAKNFGRHQIGLHIAEQILYHSEKELQAHSASCLIPISSLATLLAKPIDWWQSGITCAGNFHQFQYHYTVEFLGNDVCGEVGNATADYFRITLLVLNNREKILLQSTIVKPGHSEGECIRARYQAQIGRQSWKEATFV
jgi:hypothetical protein